MEWNITRIVEAVIIAALTAVITAVVGAKVMTAVLEERQSSQARTLISLTTEFHALRSELIDAKVKMGDRFTASEFSRWEVTHTREMENRFNALDRQISVHEYKGHISEGGINDR